MVKIVNDVPLPDNDVPLVGVLFRDISAKALTMQGAKLHWDFGDGQTSDLPNADHVYLRPGLYAVKLSVRRGGKSVETTNRIYVDRPHVNPKDKLYSLDDYLKIIETYDPKTLDAAVAAADGAGAGGEGPGAGQPDGRRSQQGQGRGRRPQPPRSTAARGREEPAGTAEGG